MKAVKGGGVKGRGVKGGGVKGGGVKGGGEEGGADRQENLVMITPFMKSMTFQITF